MNHGRLAGTGKLVILPVDQGFEHGPARSFAANPPAYDPRYHFELAIEAGCNAYAAPLGFIEAGALTGVRPGDIPLDPEDQRRRQPDRGKGPQPGAHRLGEGRPAARLLRRRLHHLSGFGNINTRCSRRCAPWRRRRSKLVSRWSIWSYPRGAALSKAGETAVDVIAYAAQIAAQLGAHIIKVKLPSDHIEQEASCARSTKTRISPSPPRPSG